MVYTGLYGKVSGAVLPSQGNDTFVWCLLYILD
jgi:hypothetical protein